MQAEPSLDILRTFIKSPPIKGRLVTLSYTRLEWKTRKGLQCCLFVFGPLLLSNCNPVLIVRFDPSVHKGPKPPVVTISACSQQNSRHKRDTVIALTCSSRSNDRGKITKKPHCCISVVKYQQSSREIRLELMACSCRTR